MQYDQVRDYSKEGVDAALKALGVASQGAQAIAVEVTDFARKSFEQGTQALEKLTSARSLDKAFEIQVEYARGAYEGLVAEGGKLGTLYANLAKDSLKPFEAFSAGRAPAA